MYINSFIFSSQVVITTTDTEGLVMIVTLTKHENTQTVQQQPKLWTTASNMSKFWFSKSFFSVKNWSNLSNFFSLKNIGLGNQLLTKNVFENFDF